MQEWGSILTYYNPTNILILAGSAANINRLVNIIREMDEKMIQLFKLYV